MPNLFDNATNKQGLIVYGGESSADYGMVISEAPAYERPKRKQTIYNVPGRNGSIIFQQDAWEDVNRSYKVWLAEDINDSLVEKVDAFEAWLNTQKGYVRLEDNFEPDVFRLAYYSGGDGFSNNLTQYGEATINFTCRPERFLKSGDTAITITRKLPGSEMLCIDADNPTKYASKPLFTFTFANAAHPKFTISMGSRLLTVDLSESGMDYADPFVVDCETMNAYFDIGYGFSPDNRNHCISGSFPYIPANGRRTGYITMLEGSVEQITSATYKPRYFTI